MVSNDRGDTKGLREFGPQVTDTTDTTQTFLIYKQRCPCGFFPLAEYEKNAAFAVCETSRD